MRGRARIKPGYGVPKPWHTPLLLLLFTPAGLEQRETPPGLCLIRPERPPSKNCPSPPSIWPKLKSLLLQSVVTKSARAPVSTQPQGTCHLRDGQVRPGLVWGKPRLMAPKLSIRRWRTSRKGGPVVDSKDTGKLPLDLPPRTPPICQ